VALKACLSKQSSQSKALKSKAFKRVAQSVTNCCSKRRFKASLKALLKGLRQRITSKHIVKACHSKRVALKENLLKQSSQSKALKNEALKGKALKNRSLKKVAQSVAQSIAQSVAQSIAQSIA
jgi:hypothetical protein